MSKRLVYNIIITLSAVLGVAGTASAELVAWWPFDEGSGTVAADLSGNGNDGTVNGGATWVDGQIGGAIQFNGTNSYVAAPHIPFNNQSFTIAMWVNPVLYTDQQVVFAQVQSNSQNLSMHYRIYGPNSGRVRMGFYSNDLDTTVTLDQGNWYHITFWYDIAGPTRRIYIDGVQVAEDAGAPYLGASGDTRIGMWNNNQWFRGIIDDVQIYNHPLSDAEIQKAMVGLKGLPLASRPNPKDGAFVEATWATMGWRPGDFAVSHDVYFGDNFDDVNAGAEAVFRGSRTDTMFIVGFPGFPYPEGLVPGTTYYWRVDEVNDVDPNSPWVGPVWSFTVPPKTAYSPVPADGAKFVATDTALSWTAGFGAKLHTVYFGDNFDAVNNATGGAPQGNATFAPSALEPGKTYYWRIDEFEVPLTHKGEVWSFTTAGLGGGIKGEYFHHNGATPHNPPELAFGTPVLTRTDDNIAFQWGNNSPDPAINVDDFAVRWTGEVEAPFTETYTFYTNTDDGVILWVDGREILRNWTDHSPTENKGDIDLVAGQTYPIEMWWYERGGGAVAELRWSSPRTPKQIVPQAALSPPVKASGPSPANGSVDARLDQILKWNPGDFAASHEVYLGTDADAVRNATKASPEFKGTKALGNESFDPGKLEWFTQYFWRIDEVNAVNPDSPWVGNLWSFTTGDFLTVENFEGYTDNDAANEAIWQHWIDGFGVNTNGSQVGNLMPPYAEQTIVHGGAQSMPVFYSNSGGVTNSEAELKLVSPRDWTAEGVGELSIWFRGRPASTGGFTQAAAGTFTVRGSGADIWNNGPAGNRHDEFHFVYKTLTGAGTIIARVDSVQNTNGWAKAGVMIRETLDGGSKHAFACVTPANGVASQGRIDTGGDSFNTNEAGVTAPHWVRLERDLAGNFTVSHSANGSAWAPVSGAVPQNIQMGGTVYVGLALTSHDAALTSQAVFSNVTITGNVSGQWASQDIGIASNAAEPLYVAVSNATGVPAVVAHPDPAAANIAAWTEWVIPLSEFSGKGINLANVDKIAVGLGSGSGTAGPGGSGLIFIDDIRLYRPRP